MHQHCVERGRSSVWGVDLDLFSRTQVRDIFFAKCLFFRFFYGIMCQTERMATVKGYPIMPSKKLDFKTGQYVVYPTQGVGKLLRIEEQTIAGQNIKMLVIDFERNHMTLRVPMERAEISGLRPLTTVKKLDEAIASAKGKAGAKRMIWARRAAQYEENINSGDPMKLAEVVRDLQRRSAADTMTFSARQLYLRALERMAQEFAVLHKIDLDAASDKIEDILGIPKEIDLNAVESDDDDMEEES